MKSNETPNGNEIVGLSLTIDPNTQKLCESYNQSSGASRGVLYVMVVITVVAIIAVFNNNWKYSWPLERLVLARDQFRHLATVSAETVKYEYINPKRYSIEKTFRENMVKELLHAYTENGYTVRYTLAGIAIDINDLVSIFGVSLILLLIVLKFLLMREKSNLQIAFNSVSERYTDNSEYNILKQCWETQNPEDKKTGKEHLDAVVSDINFVRRRYHYNFLSMNEVFNIPDLDNSGYEPNRDNLTDFINKNLFYFFIAMYSYVVLNDFCLLKGNWYINSSHTLIIEAIGFLCYIFVFNLCRECVKMKAEVAGLFARFRANGYKYREHPISQKTNLPKSIANYILKPLLFFVLIVIVARLILVIPFLGDSYMRFNVHGHLF